MAHCVTHGPPLQLWRLRVPSYLPIYFHYLLCASFLPCSSLIFCLPFRVSSPPLVLFPLTCPPHFSFLNLLIRFLSSFLGAFLQVLPSLCSYTPMCKFIFSFSFYPCRSSSLLLCFFWPHSFMVPSLIFLLPLFSILFLLSFSLIIILAISTYLMFLLSYHVILLQLIFLLSYHVILPQ